MSSAPSLHGNGFFAFSQTDRFILKEAGLCIYNSSHPYYERVVYDYELVFVTEGLLSVRENDEEINLERNQGYIFFPKSIRSKGSMDVSYGTAYFWLHFSKEQSVQQESFDDKVIPRFSSPCDPARLVTLLKWYIHDYIEGIADEDYHNTLFHLILQEFSHVDNAGKPESQNNIVSMAYQYIMSNFSKNISVSDIARSVQCTPNYLTRMFKEYYGKTTIQFLNSVKIEYAKHLLTTTTLPIKIIAIRSGFSSDLHFRKIFKQLEGCNPRSYQYSLSRIRIDPK